MIDFKPCFLLDFEKYFKARFDVVNQNGHLLVKPLDQENFWVAGATKDIIARQLRSVLFEMDELPSFSVALIEDCSAFLKTGAKLYTGAHGPAPLPGRKD